MTPNTSPNGDNQEPSSEDGAIVPVPDPQPPAAPQPIRGVASFRADIVKANLESAGATPAQIDTVLWFLDYGRVRRISGGQAGLGRLISRDASTMSRLFNGRYGAGIEKIISEIEHFRIVTLQRQDFGEAPLVETALLREIGAWCDLVRTSQTIGFLYGRSQRGKTEALKRYRDQNTHGRTIFTRMPAGGGCRAYHDALAKACGISSRQSLEDLIERFKRFFNSKMLLIVDEIHQTIVGRRIQTTTLEKIRELHDESGCGLVLAGTPTFVEGTQDKKIARFLEQLDNRGVLRFSVPVAPARVDVEAIANAYGLPPLAVGSKTELLVKSICLKSGIGKFCKYLAMSRRRANKAGEKLGWAHFDVTHASLERWAAGDLDLDGEEGK